MSWTYLAGNPTQDAVRLLIMGLPKRNLAAMKPYVATGITAEVMRPYLGMRFEAHCPAHLTRYCYTLVSSHVTPSKSHRSGSRSIASAVVARFYFTAPI